MLAILHVVHKWQSYLVGNHFIIQTDHHTLKYFLQRLAHTQFQQKQVTKLLGFDCEIQFKQGCNNQAADALLRSPLTTIDPQLHALYEGELRAISYPYSQWIDDLSMDLEKDQWIILKIQNLGATKDNNVPIANLKLKVDNGLLKYKGRMY